MDWYQLSVLIIALLGTGAAICSVIITSVNRMDNDVKALSSRMDGHAQRIDQLYTMFIDLVKATNTSK